MVSLELRIPPLLLLALFSLLMWGLAEITPSVSITVPWTLQLAAVLGVVGATLSTLGVLAFRSAATTVDPRTPDRASSLVRSGVYRLSRNPMYLGFLLVLTGWAFCLSHPLSFLLLPVFVIYMNRFQIIPEERYMLENFGTEYRSYARTVRRWI